MSAVADARHDYRRLHTAADQQVRPLADALTSNARSARRHITEDNVGRDMRRAATGDDFELAELVSRFVFAKQTARPKGVQAAIEEALESGAGVGVTFARDQRQVARLLTHLRISSPAMRQAALDLTANLVQGIGTESRQAIRQVLFEAYRDGMAPGEAAPLIRRVIGLTRGQAKVVTARSKTLGMTQQALDSFADKLLNRRALVIARTETIRAANRGQQEAWKLMLRDPMTGTLGLRQEWIVTPDDRLCALCAPMDGKTVSLGSNFESTERGVLPSERTPFAGETVEAPPLHPMCRCTVGAVFD